jgi:hypothetical protein
MKHFVGEAQDTSLETSDIKATSDDNNGKVYIYIYIYYLQQNKNKKVTSNNIWKKHKDIK